MIQQFFSTDYKNDIIFEKPPSLSHVCDVKDTDIWPRIMHMHDNCSEIVFIRKGAGDFIVDGKRYEAKEGDVLIFNSGVLHDERAKKDNPMSTYVCGISGIKIKGIEEGKLIPKGVSPLLKTINVHLIGQLFRLIVEEGIAEEKQGCNLEICRHLLCALLCAILDEIKCHEAKDTASSYSMGRQIKEYIDNHYLEPVALKDISNALGISMFYMSHVFKSEVGISPGGYILNRRLGEAQNLLISTDMPVSEICKRVGYDNVNYFHNLFKRTIGMTPGKFRILATKDNK